jgi:LPXTG-motif cell wall-anchored protein
VNRFAFVILDTRYLGPAPQCADKPTLVVADNSWRPSIPGFDAATGVLSLRIDNPHFDTDGTTVWPGKYQARIPLETAQCMWGPSVNENTTFTFDISDPEDPDNEATATVVVQDGHVVITATNFHYSGPTLSVRANTVAPQLPATGGSSSSIALMAFVMLVAGAMLVVGRRRLAD